MVKKGFLVIFLFLILISFVQSAPPQKTTSLDKGLQLEVPIINYIMVGQDFTFHVHPHNITSGELMTTSDVDWCILHLYNRKSGGHLVGMNMSADSNLLEWDLNILGGNFSEIGQYAVYIYCQIDLVGGESIGGFFEYEFYVNNKGLEVTEADSIVSTILIIGAIFIFLLCLLASVFIPFSNSRGDLGKIISVNYLKYWKVLFMSMSYITLLWVFNLLHVTSANMIMLSQFTNYFAVIFQVMNAVVWPLFIFVFVGTLFLLWKDLKLDKMLDRGINER